MGREKAMFSHVLRDLVSVRTSSRGRPRDSHAKAAMACASATDRRTMPPENTTMLDRAGFRDRTAISHRHR
jgi:hypothetical protein